MDDNSANLETLLGEAENVKVRSEEARPPRGEPATAPFYPLRGDLVLPALHDPTSFPAEQYRTIKARLDYLARSGGKPIRSLVITSPSPGDGKTLTALNLALVLAQDETKSVLIIDGDLRKPGMRDYFSHRPRFGLIQLLAREIKLAAVLFHPEGSRLMILPSGVRSTNPAELLHSKKMERLLHELGDRFDHVIIDTPPLIPFVDADELAAITDGVLLIVRSGYTTKKRVAQAVETLKKHNLIGVVLNDLKETPLDRYYNRKDYYYYTKNKT